MFYCPTRDRPTDVQPDSRPRSHALYLCVFYAAGSHVARSRASSLPVALSSDSTHATPPSPPPRAIKLTFHFRRPPLAGVVQQLRRRQWRHEWRASASPDHAHQPIANIRWAEPRCRTGRRLRTAMPEACGGTVTRLSRGRHDTPRLSARAVTEISENNAWIWRCRTDCENTATRTRHNCLATDPMY